jgi:SAM-dependent methyltransferase
MRDYESIRNAEGRGSSKPEYYLALPFEDTTGFNSGQWAIRARSFQVIEREIVSPLVRSHGRPLRILDLGAGNCWMSFRLALQGHLPVAVDLQINDQDGLGAAVHYSSRIQPLFPRIRSEVDRLPFPSLSFDLVIFDASFHYSEDYGRTFAEALRCIRPGGSIVIADTPWYAEEESGKRMVKEKHQRFKEVYGFPSDSIPSLEFLTPDRIHRLQEEFQLKWRTIKPFYGIQWHLRPVKAMLEGRRPPSQFRIYVAEVRP